MEEQPNMIRSAATFGVILGILGIAVSLIIYIIDVGLFANIWVGIVMLVVSLALVIYGGTQFRGESGGYLSFGKAFTYSFIVFAVGGLLGVTFNILLFNVIDPGAKEIVIDASLENAEKMAERFGATGDTLDQAMEDAEERTVDSYTPVGQIKGYFFALIIYAIFSLISGAIIKRKEPESL